MEYIFILIIACYLVKLLLGGISQSIGIYFDEKDRHDKKRLLLDKETAKNDAKIERLEDKIYKLNREYNIKFAKLQRLNEDSDSFFILSADLESIDRECQRLALKIKKLGGEI